jgi:hypothetical protein
MKSCLDCVASIEENSEKIKLLFMSPEQSARHNHNILLIIPVKMWQSLNVWVRHKQIKTQYMKRLRTSHEVFVAVWGGRHCLGYNAVSHGNHFPVFQRSIALIQGLEVQEKCYGRARRGKA